MPNSFTGFELDRETNLNYAGARYYDQDIGRFTSQDPVSLSLGNVQLMISKTQVPFETYLKNPQLQNSYAYAANNPIKFIDKNGEFVQLLPVIGIQVLRHAAIAGMFGLAEQGIEDTISSVQSGTLQGSGVGEYAESAGIAAFSGGVGKYAGPLAGIGTFGSLDLASGLIGQEENAVLNTGIDTALTVTGMKYVDDLRKVPGVDVSTFGKNLFTGAHTQQNFRNEAIQTGISGAGQATIASFSAVISQLQSAVNELSRKIKDRKND